MKLLLALLLAFCALIVKGQRYHTSLALEEMQLDSINRLFEQTDGAFVKQFESAFEREDGSLEYLYNCEFRKQGDVVQVVLEMPPKRRAWRSYFKLYGDGTWEDCSRNGKIRSGGSTSFFNTKDVVVSEGDSVVEILGFWGRKKDTIQSGFMYKYAYRGGYLNERWSARCSSIDRSCDWDEVGQCEVRRYLYLSNDSVIVRYYKCDEGSLPYLTVSIRKEYDEKGRVVRIDKGKRLNGCRAHGRFIERVQP